MSEIAEQPKIAEPLENFQNIGSWHQKWVISFGGTPLHVMGMITGCGIAQCYGVRHIPTNKTKEELLEALKHVRSNGVGAIVCTLGQDFFSVEPTLFKVGFEKISEYTNYRHSSSYKQRLYILKL